MSFNLVDNVKALINSDLISHAASNLGETQGGIEKAISGAIPTVTSGFLSKVSVPGGGSEILDMANQAAGSGILGNLAALFAGENTSTENRSSSGSTLSFLTVNLFEDKFTTVIRMISGFSGINETSASSVLEMVALTALAALGTYVVDNKIGASGLSQLLKNQKDSILTSVPPGLNVAGALGHNSWNDLEDKLHAGLAEEESSIKNTTGNSFHTSEDVINKATRGIGWLIPVLGGILLIAVLYYFLKGNNSSTAVAVSDSTKTVTTDTAGAAIRPDTVK